MELFGETVKGLRLLSLFEQSCILDIMCLWIKFLIKGTVMQIM